MAPGGDRTPPGFEIPTTTLMERVKRPLRRLLYPTYNAIMSSRLAARYAQTDFAPDLWLWGQRGNDYQRHRRRVNRFLPLAGRDLLIAGCGTGADVASWVAMHPRSVLAIDWFDYTRAWQKWRSQFQRTAPDVDVRFAQGDLEDLGDLPERSFDVFGSDAVFEHVRNLSRVLAQAFRVLRDGGLLYATFGPLWYAWGGDHISGYDRLDNGYNHLLLGPEDYRAYVSGAGDHSHSEHDGRTWIEHDLFSRLRPAEYLVRLHAAGLERLFVAAIVEPRAVECLKRNPAIARRLIPVYGLPSLVTTGITVVYAKSTGRRDG